MVSCPAQSQPKALLDDNLTLKIVVDYGVISSSKSADHKRLGLMVSGEIAQLVKALG